MQEQHTDHPISEDLDVLDLVGDVAPTPDLAKRLEEAGQDAKLSFEVQPNGRLKLNLDRLGALGESETLKWLRKTTSEILPRIDLPDQLFEVDSGTGFLDAFVQLRDLAALHRAGVLTAEEFTAEKQELLARI
ncbi:MAG TPA: SHOCT domain-containing protein [Nonomuraea sp.]|nr:SHOCT domain-containing protein [Nonomuraea sp.]